MDSGPGTMSHTLGKKAFEQKAAQHLVSGVPALLRAGVPPD